MARTRTWTARARERNRELAHLGDNLDETAPGVRFRGIERGAAATLRQPQCSTLRRLDCLLACQMVGSSFNVRKPFRGHMRPKLDLAAEMPRAFVDEPAEQLAPDPPDLAVIEAIHSGLERMWRDAHAAFVIA